MFGAMLVIYDHASPLAGNGDLFPGNWAVDPETGVLMGFFAMSGFQVAESWMRDPHPVRFAAKRVLRLWPPMMTVVLVMALVVGPMVTDLRSAGDYFSNPGTWNFIVRNLGMVTLIHVLPGVFAHNPWPNAVDGSLWTLPMELIAYCGLYVLFLLGAAKKQRRWMIVVAFVGIAVWDRYLGHMGPSAGGAWLSVPVQSLVAFLTAFGIGVLLCVYQIPLSPIAGIAALGGLFLMPNSEAGAMWMRFAVSYAVILTAHYWPAKLQVPSVWVNGSYGVYVWSFPVQQLLALAGLRNQWVMLVCSLPVSYLLGTASWVYVEQPTMRLRDFIAPVRAAREDPEEQGDGADEPELEAQGPEPEPEMDGEDQAQRPAHRKRPPARRTPPEPEEITHYIPRMPRRYVAEDSPLTRRLTSTADLPPVPRGQRARGRHAAPEPDFPDSETRPMPPSSRRFDRG
jgi:peptidoglycan/LPS O-acetylase OafA/YrhL